MALSVDAVSAVQIAQEARKALATLRAGKGGRGDFGAKSLALADGLQSGPFEKVRVVLSVKEAETHLKLAIAAGNTILGALDSLQSAISIADHASLVSIHTELTVGGLRISQVSPDAVQSNEAMRVSLINLHSEVNLAVRRVDALVADAGFAGANLISSAGGNVSLQTPSFGGSVDITPQPLDSAGLGLRGLNLLTDIGIRGAAVAVDKAIKLATLRLGRLAELREVLSRPDPVSTGAAQILARGRSSVVPRGSLVNLSA
ncbi:MAG: hypothetical protein ACE5FR_01790 [Rhodospirillales bacterium]